MLNRTDNVNRNTYNKENQYGISHPNAISDGDEKGKGLVDGNAGSTTDILERKKLIATNTYNQFNAYSENHPNAKSDGDEKGKGYVEGKVGSKTDNLKRTENIVKNIYKSDNQYSMEHPNAKGDGDDKGKGTGKFLDVYNYTGGSKKDVFERTENTKINVKYNPNRTYPDFPTR
jgi:hypothetical protein